MGQPPLRVDLLRAIEGIDTDDVLRSAVAGQWDGVTVRIISLDDLITNKRAVGRKQDEADVALLERVRAKRR
jgi:predicted nucleotidyltransferase